MPHFMRVGIHVLYSVQLLFQNIFKSAACLAAFDAVVNSESPSELVLTRLKTLSAKKS